MRAFRTIIAAALLTMPMAALAGDPPAYPKKVDKKLYADDWFGKKAPEFHFGNFLTAKPDTKGKVVLIDFWATWCPPCRATIPELSEFQAKFKDDLVVIGVSDEKAEVIKTFMVGTKMDYTVTTDPSATMKKKLNVSGIPHVLVISTDGIIRWQGFPLGEEKLTADVIQQVIDADPGLTSKKPKK